MEKCGSHEHLTTGGFQILSETFNNRKNYLSHLLNVNLIVDL